VHIKAADFEKDVQASKAHRSYDPQERIFSALDKATIQLTVKPDGDIASVNGLEKIREQIQKEARGNAEALAMINTSLQSYLDETRFKEMFQKTFRLFPAQGAKIGQQWTSNVEMPADMKVSYPQVQGQTVDLSLNGDQQGEILVDLSTGMVLRSDSQLRSRGKMTVYTSQVVPMKIEIKTQITGSKLDA
jgi:hypothetical protein